MKSICNEDRRCKRLSSTHVVSNEELKMKRVLIGTNSLVDEFTKKLKVLRKIDDGWSIIYKDGDTKEEWLEYVVDPERGYYRNLMLITPKPTTSELIKIAFESNNDDEIYAAAKRLEIESPKKESKFRLEILNRIKQYDLKNISDRDKERIKTCLLYTSPSPRDRG